MKHKSGHTVSARVLARRRLCSAAVLLRLLAHDVRDGVCALRSARRRRRSATGVERHVGSVAPAPCAAAAKRSSFDEMQRLRRAFLDQGPSRAHTDFAAMQIARDLARASADRAQADERERNARASAAKARLLTWADVPPPVPEADDGAGASATDAKEKPLRRSMSLKRAAEKRAVSHNRQ